MTSGIILFLVAMVGAALGEAMGQSLRRQLPLLLAFGGAFLLGLCFVHLLPEAFEANGHAGMWVIGGFLVQLGLEYLSKGLEHGHVQGNRFSTLAFLSLCLHAFIEAMPFGLEYLSERVHDHHGQGHHGHYHDHAGESGWGLLFGIGLHKLPVAIALMTILNTTAMSRMRRWTWATVFAMVPFLGILLSRNLPHDAATFGALNGLLVGILLHIATTILFETSEGHEFNSRKFPIVLLGLALSWMTTHL